MPLPPDRSHHKPGVFRIERGADGLQLFRRQPDRALEPLHVQAALRLDLHHQREAQSAPFVLVKTVQQGHLQGGLDAGELPGADMAVDQIPE